MPFPVLALGFCTLCGYVCKKAHDAYKENQETKRKKLDIKSQAIEAAKKDNEKAQAERAEWQKKLAELEQREKERNKEIQNLKEELKDPKLSNQKRQDLEEKLTSLLVSQEDDEKEKQSIFKIMKELAERIAKNNQNISNAEKNLDDSHWIWELVTLENALVAGACYAIYKLLKDDKQK